MTDKPYKFDFLQRVTDCHFGGDWLYIELFAVSPSVITPYTMQFDLIQLQGGTPGFQSIDGVAVPSVTHQLEGADFNDYRVKPGDPGNNITTAGGQRLKGFGVSYRNPGFNNPAQIYWLVQMSGFSGGKVRVRGTRDVSPGLYSNVGVSVGTITQKNMKPGIRVPNGFTFVDLLGQEVTDAVTDWLIDLRTLEITQL